MLGAIGAILVLGLNVGLIGVTVFAIGFMFYDEFSR